MSLLNTKFISTGLLGLCLLPIPALALFPALASQGKARSKPPVASASPATPLVWTDIDGRGYGPTQLRSAAATVFIFVSNDCPLASKYAARIRELADTYIPKRVSFFLVNSHPTDTVESARKWAEERKMLLPLVRDVGSSLADRLQARRTPEAVVVSREGKVIYQGRIDDHLDPALVRKHDLKNALEAVLLGKAPAIARTEVEGCIIPRVRPRAPAKSAASVTYAEHIAPILNRNCVPCHRRGEVAPFALDSYEQAKVWAAMNADVVKRRIMPPWRATPGYGEFHDSRALTDTEIKQMDTWARHGTPSGNLAKAPRVPVFPSGWPAGTPDLVLRPERPYKLAAEGNDTYRCFVLPVEFKEDTYVTLSQVLPDNRAVVHHVIVYVDTTGKKCLEMDAADPEDGFENPVAGAGAPVPGAYPLSGWAPGNLPRPAPEGVATPVPKGSRLVMEVHYHRSGREESDRTALGLTFARNTVQKFPALKVVAKVDLNLPPGEASIPVSGRMSLTDDLSLHAIVPHMHQIGKEMHVWAVKPDGEKVELIWLKDWDFNWQETYRYKTPVRLPRGTRVEMTAVFDNSASNPRNPNRPPKKITWGEASTEEMCIAFLTGLREDEQRNIQPVPWQQAVVLPATENRVAGN